MSTISDIENDSLSAPSGKITSAQEASGAAGSELTRLGYQPQLKRNRSAVTLLCQSLSIAAIPYGEGAPLLSAMIGGGPRSIFVGWILVCLLDECIAVSLGELASKYPTSAGPYYWCFQIADRGKIPLSYFTGWTWLVGNVCIALSVNFGFASFLAATIKIHNESWDGTNWEILLIFFGVCLSTLMSCVFGNRVLPTIDMACAVFTVVTIMAVLIVLPIEARSGRHGISYALGNYDTRHSGYGHFTFFIGLLPPAYTFSALGMISSMAEEVQQPSKQVPRALSLCVPVGGIAGIFFILPICFTLPPVATLVEAPYGQVLPVIFQKVMSTKAGAVSLCGLVLTLTLCCSISITNAASRCGWAFARDHAIPFSSFWAQIDPTHQVPVRALVLVTVIQMLMGLMYLGNSTAFTAFISMGVVALAIGYAVPIVISMAHGRRQVAKAQWNSGRLGWLLNTVAVAWVGFELVIFSMPSRLPVNTSSMNYAAAVWAGSGLTVLCWYLCKARKVYKGPPASDGL